MTEWRKSSTSNNTNCVEVFATPDVVGVRDSKNQAPTLAIPRTGWRVFVTSLD